MVQCSNCSKYISLTPTGKPISINIYDNGQTLVTCSGHGLADGNQIKIYDTTCTHPVEGTYVIDLAANPESEFYIPYESTVAEQCTGYFISLSDDEPDDLYDNPQAQCYSYYYLPDDGGGGGSGGGITYCGCTCANCCPTEFIWYYQLIDSISFTRCVSEAWETTVHLCEGRYEIDFVDGLQGLPPEAFGSTCAAEEGLVSIPTFPVLHYWRVEVSNVSHDLANGITTITSDTHFLGPGSDEPATEPQDVVVFYKRKSVEILTVSTATYDGDVYLKITTSADHELDSGEEGTALNGFIKNAFNPTLWPDKYSLGSVLQIIDETNLVISISADAIPSGNVLSELQGKLRYEIGLQTEGVGGDNQHEILSTPTDKIFKIAMPDTPEKRAEMSRANSFDAVVVENLPGIGNQQKSCAHVKARYKTWREDLLNTYEEGGLAVSECLFDLYFNENDGLVPNVDSIVNYLCCSEFVRKLKIFAQEGEEQGCCLMINNESFFGPEWVYEGNSQKYQGSYAWLEKEFTTIGQVIPRIESEGIVTNTCEKLPKRLPNEAYGGTIFGIEYLNTINKTKINILNHGLSNGSYIYIKSTDPPPGLQGFYQIELIEPEDENAFYINTEGYTSPSGSGYGWTGITPSGGPCDVGFPAEAYEYKHVDFKPIANIVYEILEDEDPCENLFTAVIETVGPHLLCSGELVRFTPIILNTDPPTTIPINYEIEYLVTVVTPFKFSVQFKFEKTNPEDPCFELPEGTFSYSLESEVYRWYTKCCTNLIVLDEKGNQTYITNLDTEFCTSCAKYVIGSWKQTCCHDNRTTGDCFSVSCEDGGGNLIDCTGSIGTLNNMPECSCEPGICNINYKESHTVYYKKNYYEGDTHRGFTEFIACPTPPPAAFRSRTLSQELGILSENNGFIDFYKNEKNQIEKINISKKNYKKKQIIFKINEWNDLDKSNKTYLQIKYNKKAYRKTSCIFKILEKIQETPTHYEFKVSQIFGIIPEDNMIANVEFILPPKTTSTLSKLNKLEILKRIRKRKY